MQLDSASFPHITDAIIEAAAADYRNSVAGPTAIGLRASSRAVRDQFDRHLLFHVACKGGAVFTPSLRRIPASRPAKQRLMLLTTYDRHAQHTRILDYYPASVELVETVPWRDLRVLRCSGRVPSIPATTILGNIYSSCSARPVTLPQGTRYAALRFTWDMESGDMITHQLLRALPSSLEELVILLDEEYSRKLGGRLTGHSCATETDAANAYQAAVSTVFQMQCAFVTCGGRVTFVRPNHFHFQTPTEPYLRRLAHKHIVDARFGKIPSAGRTEDTLRLYDQVGISEDDERLKDNVRVISWDEWWDGAEQLEREWLDPMRLDANDGVGESVAGAERLPAQDSAAQVPDAARVGAIGEASRRNDGKMPRPRNSQGCICM